MKHLIIVPALCAALLPVAAPADAFHDVRPGEAVILDASIGGDSDIANMADVCPTIYALRQVSKRFAASDDPHDAVRGCRLFPDETKAHVVAILGPLGTTPPDEYFKIVKVRIDATGYVGYLDDVFVSPRR